MQNIRIRQVQPTDLARLTEIEAVCFPAAEAASGETISARVKAFPASFLVAESNGGVIGFINGCVTNGQTIRDELFASTEHHEPDGETQTVFGLDVLPDYRRQGVAALLMRRFIENAKAAGRARVILTCKSHLVHYYETFGFTNQGVSQSTHGGATWYDMTLKLVETQ